MAVTIQGNSYLSINREISDARIKKIEKAQSREEATAMGIWDKIKDWFCVTKKSEALSHIYDLIHHDQISDTESALKKIKAFYHLSKMVSDVYKDRFQATITENANGNWQFEFSINGTLNIKHGVCTSNENNIELFFANIQSFLQEQDIGTPDVALYNQVMATLAGLKTFNVVLVNKCLSFPRIAHLISDNTKDTDILVLKNDFSGQQFFSFANKNMVEQSPEVKKCAIEAGLHLRELQEVKDYLSSVCQMTSKNEWFTAEKLKSINDFNLIKLKNIYAQEPPSSINLDEIYKTPSEVTFMWMSLLRDAVNKLDGSAKEVVCGLLKNQQSRYMQHKELTLSATRDSLINDSVILRKEQLDTLADFAYEKDDAISSLVAQLPVSDKDLHPTRLHDNIYGRVFESNWIAELVANTPNEVRSSMHLIAKYLANYFDDLDIKEKESVIKNLKTRVVTDRRFWFKKVPNMEQLSNPQLSTKVFLKIFKEILCSKIKSGEQCIAIPYLAVKLFGVTNKVSDAEWRVKTNNNYVYNIKPRTGRIYSDMMFAKDNLIQVPAAGITMRHHIPAVSYSEELPITSRPSLDYHIPSSDKIDKFPAVKNALKYGLPYSGGVSGSTGIMLSIIEEIQKKEGKEKMDLRIGLLGTIMFLNYDGGHSIHESLWVANQTGRLNLASVPANEGNVDEFVSDYEIFQALYRGTECESFLAEALSKAWTNTNDYLIKNNPDYKKLTIPEEYKKTT